MTVQDIANKVLALLDDYTEDGDIVAETDHPDIVKKIILFTDMAQKELWKNNKKTATKLITRKPPESMLDDGFTMIDFEGTTQYYPNESGVSNVQGYAFKVSADASDNATITIQENVGGTWTARATITPTGITELTEYKGAISVASTSNKVRIKVEGDEHFIHQDRALWKNKYKSASVPSMSAWVKYELPSNFNSIDSVVELYDVVQYSKLENYKLENFRDFYVAFDYEGSIRITYKPIPTTITALTDTITIDDILAETIVYDVAAKIGFYENQDLVNWAEGRRLEGKSDASTNESKPATVIVDYYG